MTKEQAEKEVQRLLSEARALIGGAERLMDAHRFTVSFEGRDYCPRDLTIEEIEFLKEGELDFPYNQDWMEVGDGGVWMGSSDIC